MELDFKDKTVLITGGASGAGRKIVDVFVKAGANVALTYHHTRPGKLPKNVRAYQLDQRDVKQIPDLLKTVYKEMGTIDVLVANAGIYPSRSMEKITEEDWDEMLETNTKAIFFLNREVSHYMRSGSIINISSINATNPASKLIHYGASKAARPFNSRLDKTKLAAAGFTPLPEWKDALHRYLAEIGELSR